MAKSEKPIYIPAPENMPAAILARERADWDRHLGEHPSQRNICRHCGQVPLSACIRGMIPQLIGGGGPYDFPCPRIHKGRAMPEPEPQTHELANQDNLPF